MAIVLVWLGGLGWIFVKFNVIFYCCYTMKFILDLIGGLHLQLTTYLGVVLGVLVTVSFVDGGVEDVKCLSPKVEALFHSTHPVADAQCVDMMPAFE